MKRAPSVWTVTTLTSYLRNGPQSGIGGDWFPTRPHGMFSIKSRACLAWEVFTGRADVLRWPGKQ